MMAWPVTGKMLYGNRAWKGVPVTQAYLAQAESPPWWRRVGMQSLFRTVAAFQPQRVGGVSFIDSLGMVM